MVYQLSDRCSYRILAYLTIQVHCMMSLQRSSIYFCPFFFSCQMSSPLKKKTHT